MLVYRSVVGLIRNSHADKSGPAVHLDLPHVTAKMCNSGFEFQKIAIPFHGLCDDIYFLQRLLYTTHFFGIESYSIQPKTV